MTRMLTISTLFPNAEQPNHGIFVENRLRHTLALGGLEATVVAPVPYFPFKSQVWGRYGAFARVPPDERRFGVSIFHPRFLVVPKIGAAVAPRLVYHSARRALRKLMDGGLRFDVIDAHYFYPDGVAAALLAREFKRPLVITGRGSDLTLLPKHPFAREQIRWAAQEADALITVSESLKKSLVGLGVRQEKIAVLRNGVEIGLFMPLERRQIRSKLGIDRFAILCVGGLIPLKGHNIAIDALAQLPDCELLIIGAGPMRTQLERRVSELGVEERVRFLGEIAHRNLPQYYNAADVMVLMSEREGWANVILESLACGTPVISTDVGGASEIIRDRVAGRLLRDRNPNALALEITALRSDPPTRAMTRRYAEAFSWQPVAAANKALLSTLAAQRISLTDIAQEFSVSGPVSLS